MKIEEVLKIVKDGGTAKHLSGVQLFLDESIMEGDEDTGQVNLFLDSYYFDGWEIVFTHGFYKDNEENLYFYNGTWFQYVIDGDGWEYNEFYECSEPRDKKLIQETKEGLTYKDYDVYLGVKEGE